MAKHQYTKEEAAEAGRKSRRGKSEKTKMWEALGEMITNEGANKAVKILNSMEGREFLQNYSNLLEYFKPKLQRSDITSNDKPIQSPLAGLTFSELYELKYGRKPDK